MQNFLTALKINEDQKALMTAQLPMSIHKEIDALHCALQANNGIMPPAWVPYANILITALTLIEPVVPANVKAIIAVLIAAIQAAE
jgi:hypothetical protein